MGTIMRDGDRGPQPSRRPATDPAVAGREHPAHGSGGPAASGWVIETVVSPFHCLYQDALHFHTQSQLWLARSEGESSRLARAALLLYLASAEALVHQAAVELGRPELAKLAADPDRPLPLADAWRLLPAIVADVHAGPFDPSAPPWPQFAELLALRTSWAYPGPPATRRAYYRSPRRDAALRAARAAPGPAGARRAARPPALSPRPACRATPTRCGPAISTPPAASSTPPSRPSTAASAAP